MKKTTDYLHYYLGCNVELEQSDFSLKAYGILLAVSDKEIKVKCKQGNSQHYQKINFQVGEVVVRPILRSLDDWSIRDSIRHNIPMVEMAEIFASNQYSPEIFHMLINERFDLFHLIKQGLAINKPVNHKL